MIVIGEYLREREPEYHSQCQSRLVIAERIETLLQQPHRRGVIGAGLPAEGDIAAGETQSRPGERHVIAACARGITRVPESLACPGQIGGEQLLLAKLQQQRCARAQIRLLDQSESAAQVGGGLLVIVSLGCW